MKPKEVIELLVTLYNKGDAEKIAELYHEDAIIHQVANEPVEGKEVILAMFENEFSTADMTCIVENIFEEGNWDKLSFLRMNNLPIPSE